MTESTSLDSIEDYRFVAYLGDAMPLAERSEFVAWVDADPERAQRFAAARAAWTAGVRLLGFIDSHAAWSRVRAAIARHGREPERPSRDACRIPVGMAPVVGVVPASALMRFRARVRPHRALVAVGVALSCIAGWMLLSPKPSERIGHTYRTAEQYATFVLADGSRIQLAPHSRVAVGDDFGQGNRTVSVTGEAYFTVPHASGAPFRVRTGRVETRVLGTAFAVRYDVPRGTVRVSVASGKVNTTWNHGTRSVTLTAGTVAQLTDSTAVVTALADPAKRIDWQNGQLAFRDVRVSQVLSTLGLWYGFEFRLDDSTLAKQYLSDTFECGPPADMLNALKALLDVNMTFDGSIVTLHARHPGASRAPVQRETRDQLSHPLYNEVGR